jgi:Tfp pilus assembly protein PilV
MKKIALNQKGFTIIEVTITTFLLVVAFLGLLSLSVMAIKGNAFSKMMTTATALGNDKIEDLKAGAFTNVELNSGSHTDTGNPFQGLYTRTWTITDTIDATSSRIACKTIAVSVSWNWLGKTHNVSFNTLQANQDE